MSLLAGYIDASIEHSTEEFRGRWGTLIVNYVRPPRNGSLMRHPETQFGVVGKFMWSRSADIEHLPQAVELYAASVGVRHPMPTEQCTSAALSWNIS